VLRAQKGSEAAQKTLAVLSRHNSTGRKIPTKIIKNIAITAKISN
jgi:hypothetical protein